MGASCSCDCGGTPDTDEQGEVNTDRQLLKKQPGFDKPAASHVSLEDEKIDEKTMEKSDKKNALSPDRMLSEMSDLMNIEQSLSPTTSISELMVMSESSTRDGVPYPTSDSDDTDAESDQTEGSRRQSAFGSELALVAAGEWSKSEHEGGDTFVPLKDGSPEPTVGGLAVPGTKDTLAIADGGRGFSFRTKTSPMAADELLLGDVATEEMKKSVHEFESLVNSGRMITSRDIAMSHQKQMTERLQNSSMHPPLEDAILEVEFVSIDLNPPMESITHDDSLKGSSTQLVSKRSRSGAGTPSSVRSRSGSSSSTVKERRGVYIKAEYSRNGRTTTETTSKYNSRGYDANIIDVREKKTFILEKPDSSLLKPTESVDLMDHDSGQMSGIMGGAGGHGHHKHTHLVSGRIEIRVKQGTGTFSKSNKLGFGSIKINHSIFNGAISRRGDTRAYEIPLYDLSSAEFKAKRLKARKKAKSKKSVTSPSSSGSATDMSGSGGMKREKVGILMTRCTLRWDSKVMQKWSKKLDSEVEKPSSLIDQYYLSSRRKSKLHLFILGAVISESAQQYTQYTIRSLENTLKTEGTESEYFDSVMKNVSISAGYVCDGSEPSNRLTKSYNSKLDDVIYFGEEIKFDVQPFLSEAMLMPCGTSMLHEGSSPQSGEHPQITFGTNQDATSAPGSILFELLQSPEDTKSKAAKSSSRMTIHRKGCCLILVSHLLSAIKIIEATTVASAGDSSSGGRIESTEVVLTEPLIESLSDAEMADLTKTAKHARKNNRKWNPTGYVFVKARFTWD